MSTVPKLDPASHQEQLEKLRSQVEELRERLRRAQRLATVGTMTAMVAHEFNNILMPIINYAQMARKNPALVDKAIAQAADGGERATNICKAILGFARDGPAQPVVVNLAELTSETLSAMARDPSRDGIKLIFRSAANLKITTRRVELQHVLLNLLINARAAVLAKPPPRHIDVEAERKARRIFIRVKDNGIGIPPENLERIFQPFFSTKTETDGEQGGHGLGLAVCREIVAGLGGRITVDSKVGEGSTFTVCLPVDPPARAIAG